MRYTTIARDGLRFSRIGIGGNIFGYLCDAAQTSRILGLANDLGVNLVDTADVYSCGRSEEHIGNAVRTNRQNWVIATKAGIPSGALSNGCGSAKNLHRKLDGSLARLKTDFVDIYQVHHFDPATPIEETIGALECQRAAGKIRVFGVSNYSAAAVQAAAVCASSSGARGFSTIQCHYNLFARSAELSLFPVCHTHDLAILAYGVVARGVLAGKYKDGHLPPDSRAALSESIRRDLSPDVLNAVSDIERLAQSRGATASQLAVAWVLRNSAIASALVGIRDARQLRQIADAVYVEMSDGDLLALEAIAAPIARETELGFGTPMVFG
jgi:aryl-alcohol dehydrogenase-like predicted oxidoreductase